VGIEWNIAIMDRWNVCAAFDDVRQSLHGLLSHENLRILPQNCALRKDGRKECAIP
jgi:hypothetical protein